MLWAAESLLVEDRGLCWYLYGPTKRQPFERRSAGALSGGERAGGHRCSNPLSARLARPAGASSVTFPLPHGLSPSIPRQTHPPHSFRPVAVSHCGGPGRGQTHPQYSTEQPGVTLRGREVGRATVDSQAEGRLYPLPTHSSCTSATEGYPRALGSGGQRFCTSGPQRTPTT